MPTKNVGRKCTRALSDLVPPAHTSPGWLIQARKCKRFDRSAPRAQRQCSPSRLRTSTRNILSTTISSTVAVITRATICIRRATFIAADRRTRLLERPLPTSYVNLRAGRRRSPPYRDPAAADRLDLECGAALHHRLIIAVRVAVRVVVRVTTVVRVRVTITV